MVAGVGKSAIPVAKVAASIGAGATAGALIGAAGAALGFYRSWQTARYRRERKLYKRLAVAYLLGLSVFLAPFIAMSLGWWGPQAIGQPAYLFAFLSWMLGFFAASGLWIWYGIRRWRRIVAEEVAAGSPELPATSVGRLGLRGERRHN